MSLLFFLNLFIQFLDLISKMVNIVIGFLTSSDHKLRFWQINILYHRNFSYINRRYIRKRVLHEILKGKLPKSFGYNHMVSSAQDTYSTIYIYVTVNKIIALLKSFFFNHFFLVFIDFLKNEHLAFSLMTKV